MVQRFGETALITLTDRADPPTGAIDPTVVDAALSDAEAMIHGYARTAGYKIPFTPVPPDNVLLWEAVIAFYLLHGQAIAVPEKTKDDYQTALSQLKDVATGKLKLEAAGSEELDADDHLVVLADSPKRIFTDHSLKAF